MQKLFNLLQLGISYDIYYQILCWPFIVQVLKFEKMKKQLYDNNNNK